MTPRHLLILGGTAEAAELAAALGTRFGSGLKLTSSLAGRTEHPAPLPGIVRIGGFGGTDGLTAWLGTEAVDLVIDATHPFAAAISTHAAEACAALGLPRLRLQRPPWPRHPLDRWVEVESVAGAAHALKQMNSRRVFLTVGATDLEPFADLDAVWFLVRMIDPPPMPLPFLQAQLLLGRGPFSCPEEALLLRHHRIDTLVTKASGGSATEAKLIAAREADLPVVMVRRPPPPPGPLVETVAEAVEWVSARR